MTTDVAMSPLQMRSIAEADARVNIWNGSVRSGKAGKCWETTVLTPTGFRVLGDLRAGDQVCNPDGTVAQIVGAYDRGPMQFYRVTLQDGATVEAAGDHLWNVAVAQRRVRARSPLPAPPSDRPEDVWNHRVMSRTRVMTTDQMITILDKGRENLLLPLTMPVSQRGGKRQWESFSPYIIGALLGDGHFGHSYVSFVSADPEIVERIGRELPAHLHMRSVGERGAAEVFSIVNTSKTTAATFGSAVIAAREERGWTQRELAAKLNITPARMSAIERGKGWPTPTTARRIDDAIGAGGVLAELAATRPGESSIAYIRREGLDGLRSWDKYIPEHLKHLGVEDRFALVQGLMDTDGSIDAQGHAEYTTVSERLARDMQDVLRSLGFKATLSSKDTSYTHKGEKLAGRTAYRLYIQGRDMAKLFHLSRKRERARAYLGNEGIEPMHRIVSIEPTDIAEARCIEVSHPNSLYITDDYIVTHNTISSIMRWFMFIANPPKQPGQFVMVGRTRDSLARNVIDVMQDQMLFGDLAGEVHYRHGSPFATILGRKVYVLGAHDNQAEKVIRGLTVAGAYVDEVTVIQEDFFKQMLARMSVDDAKLFGTTNPDNPMHWLKAEYLDRIGTGEGKLEDWRSWHFTLDDNPRLSERYKNSLKAEYSGLWYRRFILGHWVAAEGAVFDFWDPDTHSMSWSALPLMRELMAIGVDYGTTNPTVAILLGLGEDNVLYLIDEWSHESKNAEERWSDVKLSQGIRRFHRTRHLPLHPSDRFGGTERPCDFVLVDPAAASLRVQLAEDGLSTYAADNDVEYGIKLMAALLSRGKLKITDRCARLLREIPGYSWDTKASEAGTDKPIKVNDHAVDAARYAIVSTEGRWRPYIDSTDDTVA